MDASTRKRVAAQREEESYKALGLHKAAVVAQQEQDTELREAVNAEHAVAEFLSCIKGSPYDSEWERPQC